MSVRTLVVLLAVTLLTLGGPASASGDHTPASAESADLFDYVEGADRLEGRIRAPCCWNQTLDIHASEVSNELRREIRRRLRTGETPDVIEADIVKRYGERVLAVPPGSPLKKFAIGLSIAFGAAGIGAAFMLARWRRRTVLERARAEAQPKQDKPDEWDERLESELDKLD